jgi:hypothetical protein
MSPCPFERLRDSLGLAPALAIREITGSHFCNTF